jgi:hypothetical protein
VAHRRCGDGRDKGLAVTYILSRHNLLLPPPLHPYHLPLTIYYSYIIIDKKTMAARRCPPPPPIILLPLLHGEWEYPSTDTLSFSSALSFVVVEVYESSSWSAGPPSFLLPGKTWDVPTVY